MCAAAHGRRGGNTTNFSCRRKKKPNLRKFLRCDGLHDLCCQFDGGQAVLGGDLGQRTILHGVDEGFEFGSEGIGVVDLQFLDGHEVGEIEIG